jgi:transcriptional regulator with XRE-family HTH domain
MDIHQKTGLAIVQLRKEQGISQYNLALKANITFRYLSDIENGKRNLSLNILEKIANALGVKVSKILEMVENME